MLQCKEEGYGKPVTHKRVVPVSVGFESNQQIIPNWVQELNHNGWSRTDKRTAKTGPGRTELDGARGNQDSSVVLSRRQEARGRLPGPLGLL